MHLNEIGKQIIKDTEGLRLEAYKCPAGVWTIGYGHTMNVNKGDRISKVEAERLFEEDSMIFSDLVRKTILVNLNDNQFSALVSLAYNIGIGAFRKSSILKFINQGEFEDAAKRFLQYCKARDPKTNELITLPGLLVRRKAEMNLFLEAI